MAGALIVPACARHVDSTASLRRAVGGETTHRKFSTMVMQGMAKGRWRCTSRARHSNKLCEVGGAAGRPTAAKHVHLLFFIPPRGGDSKFPGIQRPPPLRRKPTRRCGKHCHPIACDPTRASPNVRKQTPNIGTLAFVRLSGCAGTAKVWEAAALSNVAGKSRARKRGCGRQVGSKWGVEGGKDGSYEWEWAEGSQEHGQTKHQ